MKLASNDDGVSGAFEELPTLLVVIVAVSLFAVSVAHASASWNESSDREALRNDCLIFAGMVQGSETLCQDGEPGTFSAAKLQNFSAQDFLAEFNETGLGFEYRVTVQCLDLGSGNETIHAEARTAEPPGNAEIATFGTCMNVDCNGVMGAARLTVTVWRPG